jgi:hypothetical protein
MDDLRDYHRCADAAADRSRMAKHRLNCEADCGQGRGKNRASKHEQRHKNEHQAQQQPSAKLRPQGDDRQRVQCHPDTIGTSDDRNLNYQPRDASDQGKNGARARKTQQLLSHVSPMLTGFSHGRRSHDQEEHQRTRERS